MQLAQEAWFLTGPTAVGKTAVALALAEKIGAEIVSMDSMAIYRGMDIGTAKPTPDQRRQVPHHLIDLVEPSDDFSLAQYLDAAHAAAAEIRCRGRQALFAGGTPLYLKGLLRGIFQGPPADWEFRRTIVAEAAANGPDWLHERLRAVDPAAAARLHARDTRRLVRALGGLPTHRPADQRVATAVRSRGAGRRLPRLRARPAAGRAARPHRPPRGGHVCRGAGRRSAAAVGTVPIFADRFTL